MNDFFLFLIAVAIALGFIYWRLRKTNRDFPIEAEKYMQGAKSWQDGLQSQIVTLVNPHKGEPLN